MTLFIRESTGLRQSEDLVLGSGIHIKNTVDGVPELQATAVGVKAYLTANVAMPTGAWVVLAFTGETFDDGLHSTTTTPSRFIAPTGLGGKYLVTAHAVFTAAGAAGDTTRLVRLRKNGTLIEAEGRLLENGSGTTVSLTTVAKLNAGDYLEMLVYQDSGGTLYACGSSVQYTTFTMVRLGA
ncbi:MAG TPA: hypothetical protein VHG91_02735 [Longimicrobium sp.]|nr:hypothetical protein [Longimicrobium sp.]